MALISWVLHSACHVLGYPITSEIHQETPKITERESNRVDGNQMGSFRMPLHYPRYTKSDYDKMEEWKVDMLLQQYGITLTTGSIDEKREFAKGTFLWPDQY